VPDPNVGFHAVAAGTWHSLGLQWNTEMPAFTPTAGTFGGSVLVTLSCTTTGAVIRYTTDGTDPTESSPAYTAPLSFTDTTFLKAKAFKTGAVPSAVARGRYTVREPGSIVAWDPTAATNAA